MPIRPTICHVYVNGAQKLSRRPMQDSVFIAHSYYREQAQMEDYRLPYKDSLEGKLKYRAIFADLEAMPGTLLSTICQHIIDTEVGVYDVTGYNENVLIELGLALGLNRPVLVVARDDGEPLVEFLEDLKPLRYRSKRELAEGLAQRVPQHLRLASDGRISPRYCETCLAECPLVRQRQPQVDEAYAVIGVDSATDEDLHYNLMQTMERFEMEPYTDEDHAHPHLVCAWVYRLRRIQMALFHLKQPYRVREQAAVHLQLGIAAGLGTPWMMILPEATDRPPTDLRGLLHVNFGEHQAGFRQQLSNSIRGLLLNRLNAPQIYAPLPPPDPALLEEQPSLADVAIPEGATVVLLADAGDDLRALIEGPVVGAVEAGEGAGRVLLHAQTPEAVFDLWQQAGEVALIVMGYQPPLRSADLRQGLATLDEGTNRPPVVSVYLNPNDAVIDVRDTSMAMIRETFTLPQDELANFAPAFINRQLAPPESPRRVLVLLDADDTTNDPQNRRAIRELVAANYPALFEFTTPEADAFRGRLAVRDRRPDAVVIDAGSLRRISGKAFFDALMDTFATVPPAVLYDANDIAPGDYARAQVFNLVDNNPLAEIAFPLVADPLRESLDRAFSGAVDAAEGEPATDPNDITVLVLDGDATRPALVAALKPEGYTLLEAHTVRSAQDAIELFQRGEIEGANQDEDAPPARLVNVVALRDTSYDFDDLRDTVSLFSDLSPGVRVIVMQPQYDTDRVAAIEGVVGIFSGDESLLPDALVRNVRDVLAHQPELADSASGGAGGPDFEQLSPEQLEAWLEQMAERMADREGAAAAIRQQAVRATGQEPEARMVDTIADLTGGHPRLIQATGALLGVLRTELFTAQQRNEIVGRLARVPAVGQAARAIWETLGDAEREVLQLVASGEQRTLEDEGQAAITRLIKGRLLRVDKENQSLRVEPPLLQAAIRQNFVIEAEEEDEIARLERELVDVRKKGDIRSEEQILIAIGDAYQYNGDFVRALDYYEQALVIAREIGDRRGEGNALGNLGNAYTDLGEVRRAIEYHEQALVIARAIGDRMGEGSALGSLGAAYRPLGEVRLAIDFYEQALVIAREIGDRMGEGNVLNNLGVAYEDLGDYVRALELYQAALVIRRSIGNPRLIAETEQSIARMQAPTSAAPAAGGIVFVNHAYPDWQRVRPFVERMAAAGIPTWVKPGDQRIDTTEAAVEACTAMVLFITADSLKQAYVEQAYVAAMAANKSLFPVMLDEDVNLPLALVDRAYITEEYFDELLPTLRDAANQQRPEDALVEGTPTDRPAPIPFSRDALEKLPRQRLDTVVELYWGAQGAYIIEDSPTVIGRGTERMEGRTLPFERVSIEHKVFTDTGFDRELQYMSREHVVVFQHEGVLRVLAVADNNWTFLNDEELANDTAYALRDGDVLRLSQREYNSFAVRIGEATAPVDKDESERDFAYDVYMSYRRSDQFFMKHFSNDLEDAGFRVWVDAMLRPGEDWRDAIQAAMDDSRVMLLIMSPEAMESEIVTSEWQSFMDQNKPIIPVLVRETRIPSPLNELQYIDFTRGYDRQAVAELMLALRDALGTRSPFEGGQAQTDFNDDDADNNSGDDDDSSTRSSFRRGDSSSSSQRSSGGGFLRRIFGGSSSAEGDDDE